jgi:prophage regulatory protein
MSDSLTPTKRSVRPANAAAKLGVSLPTLWRWARNVPDFPKPIKLSERVTVFDESELDAYVASRRVPA